MPGSVNATIIWEDNPDTSINATNLSKSININSDSKFIEYSESTIDYGKWADYEMQEQLSPSIQYVDKIVWVHNPGKFIKGVKINDNYEWIESGFSTPLYKMLKIKANTKISMSYIDLSGNIKYINFDIGNQDSLFSIESLLVATDFSPNFKYNIYLYNTTTLGDNAQLRIVSEYDDSLNTGGWKEGTSDPGSPTGKKVVAIRKIGGFKTNENGNIDINSLWDLSTYQKEVITEKYKIFNSDGVRDLTASDIPLVDAENNFTSINVEDGLRDVKVSVDQFYEDMYYTADRYGVELEYSIFTKNNNSIIPIDLNNNSLTIPLRITPGYINIAGRRIVVENPIYLGDPSLQVKINNSPLFVNNVILGGIPGDPYSSTTEVQVLYPGIWRVYINSDGIIIFRQGDMFVPRFLVETVRKGWYYTHDNSRCIGKFRVRSGSEGFYIEKMSITNTFDIPVPKNTIHFFHGTMCPDGLFLCNGLWHDTKGYSAITYNDMPAPLGPEWAQSWWEQSPNLFGRTIKMFDEDDFQIVPNNTVQKTVPQSAFKWQLNQNQTYAIIQSGGSNECGESAGNNLHSHAMPHKHSPNQNGGDLAISSSTIDTHSHGVETMNIEQPADSVQAVLYTGGGQTSILVSPSTHKHSGSITASGIHGHSNGVFVGRVGEPTIDNTAEANNWAPYKEIIMCIKL